MTRGLSPLVRILNRVECPAARKTLVMSKWERGHITGNEAARLIHLCGLEAA